MQAKRSHAQAPVMQAKHSRTQAAAVDTGAVGVSALAP